MRLPSPATRAARRPAARLLLAALGAGLPGALGAQARVAGAVRDSLERAPLGGALVQLVPAAAPGSTPRLAAADSAGAWAMDGVAPGRYLVTFSHPRLDSLGVAAPTRALEVPAGAPAVRADLASPSARALAAALCGPAAAGDSVGVLFGRVLDAERGDGVGAERAAVMVRWGEVVADAAGVRRVVRRLRAPAAPDGRYVACGLPAGVPVAVGAAAAGSGGASGEVELTVAAERPVAYRDLLVGASGAPRGTAGLAGRVRREDGRPAAGARVVVRGSGAADTVARADAEGRYQFDRLPAGTYRVDALAIGFTPVSGVADLRSGRTAALDLAVGRSVATLDPVAVYGRRRVSQFEQHMQRGIGRFVTEAQLQRGGQYGFVNALSAAPGFRIMSVDPNGAPEIRATGVNNIRGTPYCAPEVYLDGAFVPDGFRGLYQFISPTRIVGVEIYTPLQTPPRFRQPGATCASVVVWTRAAMSS